MQRIIDLILSLIPQNYKTYAAAAVAGLLAVNAALAAGGIEFLPPRVAEVVAWLAAALGLVGLRHAISKSAALIVFLGIGLLTVTGCTVVVKDERPPAPGLGCNCAHLCKCGAACACKPGAKCCHACDCKPKAFELTTLPTAPPDMYVVANDGERNGWWKLHSPPGGWYGWWHDGELVGTYSSDGAWWHGPGVRHGGHSLGRAAPAPWLAGCHFGVDPAKVGKSDRLLSSGGSDGKP